MSKAQPGMPRLTAGPSPERSIFCCSKKSGLFEFGISGAEFAARLPPEMSGSMGDVQ
jgi:hypothetical protein